MLFVGNQTSCSASSPLVPFEYALAHAFDAFEWFPDKKPASGWDEADLPPRARQEIRETALARGLRLSVHAQLQSNPLSPEGLTVLATDLALARDVGANLLNVHLFHEQGLEPFIISLHQLIQQTAELGLQLAIENTPLHPPELFNELFARLRSRPGLPAAHVGMCFDLGHANLCSATLNDYLAFYDRLDPQVPIIHLHLHENWGDADSHLPLFTGPASRDDSGIRALLTRLAQRRFSGSAILEQWPNPPSLLDEARARLLRLWNPKPPEPPRNVVAEPAAPKNPPDPNPSPPDLPVELAAEDRQRPSWREKLDLVRTVLTREEPPLAPHELIDVAIYLRFLGTGELTCLEDGRHFRPSHHARIASEIHRRLETLTTPETGFIVRQIYPWLPAFTTDFRHPEPLTRIRDIAHRNDIPSELKQEIKTTLQNKLHRCAGPEDLATSAALLHRITAPGTSYAPSFVEQFKTFHEELKEFFNASSLEKRLTALLPSAEDELARLLRLFLQQKTGRSLSSQVAGFRTLTALRETLLKAVSQTSDVERSELILADLALEDFAFVLLSSILPGTEMMDAPAASALQTQLLTLALSNLASSGIDSLETKAVRNEMVAWGELDSSTGRDECLRLKATLLRCRRLSQTFEAETIALFSRRAEKLGAALQIPAHAIRVFCESQLRGHLVFQASKLVSALLKSLRQRLALPAWDVLVPGCAVGRLQPCNTLDDFHQGQPAPVIVLLKTAVGDEELPQQVAGLVLAQEMPLLSHFSVRARQAGTVFVTCEEASEFERLRRSAGQSIRLLALPDRVTWEPAPLPANLTTTKPGRSPPRLPHVRISPDPDVIELDQATPETSGGKAIGARRLAELSRQNPAGFATPASLVIPFGLMEQAIAAVPGLADDYRSLLERFDATAPSELAIAAQRLRQMVLHAVVPGTILSSVKQKFPPDSRLAVRSSANGEDLDDFAGAGLYDSVLNVGLSDVASAVRTVWSSLWTERAASARRAARIPHPQAHMAILIQEMVEADFSFVLHTVNPSTRAPGHLYAEIVVGLGDTLASAATSGGPYRLVCNKTSGAVETLAFANFSTASHPNPVGGLARNTLDYSRVSLSREVPALHELGRRLSALGVSVEQALGKPQDIEGALSNGQIYLVQARPQMGLIPGNPPPC